MWIHVRETGRAWAVKNPRTRRCLKWAKERILNFAINWSKSFTIVLCLIDYNMQMKIARQVMWIWWEITILIFQAREKEPARIFIKLQEPTYLPHNVYSPYRNVNCRQPAIHLQCLDSFSRCLIGFFPLYALLFLSNATIFSLPFYHQLTIRWRYFTDSIKNPFISVSAPDFLENEQFTAFGMNWMAFFLLFARKFMIKYHERTTQNARAIGCWMLIQWPYILKPMNLWLHKLR